MINLFKKISQFSLRIILFFSIIITALFILLFIINQKVEKETQKSIFSDTQTIPYNKVGLLLGTSKYLATRTINPYYQYRIDAAVALYQAGKIDLILASGDNSTIYYNEPTTIKKDLIKRGIPAERIYLDYAGFRTLDSIIRSNKIFGQESITVISQQFHNERAVYIAQKKGITAIGFNAQDVPPPYGTKTQVREKFARALMVFDLLFKTEPKFFGEKIIMKIPENNAKKKTETL